MKLIGMILHNDQLRGVIRIVKSRRLRLTWHVAGLRRQFIQFLGGGGGGPAWKGGL
jgi:hypothetical protein